MERTDRRFELLKDDISPPSQKDLLGTLSTILVVYNKVVEVHLCPRTYSVARKTSTLFTPNRAPIRRKNEVRNWSTTKHSFLGSKRLAGSLVKWVNDDSHITIAEKYFALAKAGGES